MAPLDQGAPALNPDSSVDREALLRKVTALFGLPPSEGRRYRAPPIFLLLYTCR